MIVVEASLSLRLCLDNSAGRLLAYMAPVHSAQYLLIYIVNIYSFTHFTISCTQCSLLLTHLWAVSSILGGADKQATTHAHCSCSAHATTHIKRHIKRQIKRHKKRLIKRHKKRHIKTGADKERTTLHYPAESVVSLAICSSLSIFLHALLNFRKN